MVHTLAAAATWAEGAVEYGEAAWNIPLARDGASALKAAQPTGTHAQSAATARDKILDLSADAALRRLSAAAAETIAAQDGAARNGCHAWCQCTVPAAPREHRGDLVHYVRLFSVDDEYVMPGIDHDVCALGDCVFGVCVDVTIGLLPLVKKGLIHACHAGGNCWEPRWR